MENLSIEMEREGQHEMKTWSLPMIAGNKVSESKSL